MANTLSFFMLPEDEVSFLRALEPHGFEVYPETCAPSFKPFRAGADCASLLTDEAYYLLLTAAGEPVLRTVRRGPHRGMIELDEIGSPVMHWVRSRPDEDGVLRSGRLWTELEAVGDRQHVLRKPDLMRSVFEDIRSFFKKRFVRSNPTGFFVGPIAARKVRDGLRLREEGRKGVEVEPYR